MVCARVEYFHARGEIVLSPTAITTNVTPEIPQQGNVTFGHKAQKEEQVGLCLSEWPVYHLLFKM